MKRFSIATIVCLSALLYAKADVIILSEVMSREEQKKTGVYNLTANQKAALQDWLNENFILKSNLQTNAEEEKKPLYLSQNLDNGKILRLSDDSEYLVAPEDIINSSFWITPFPLRIEPSDDPEYPLRIVNINNGQYVKVRQTKPPRNISSPPPAAPSPPQGTGP